MIFFWCMGCFVQLKAQQLTAEERNDLKMELIQIRQDLSILKAWKHRQESIEVQLEKTKDYHQTLLESLDQQLDQLEATQENIAQIRQEIRRLRIDNRNLFEKVVFKVQIQAAVRQPLDRFGRRFPFFTVYPERRLNLYLLGHFYHYQEAKFFSNWLNRHGNSTYVVGFKRGRRVRMLYNYTQK